MYVIVYVRKSGAKQVGRAPNAAEANQKVHLYKAAGATDFEVTDPEGRKVPLSELQALADLGH